jgi:hypothetical protein
MAANPQQETPLQLVVLRVLKLGCTESLHSITFLMALPMLRTHYLKYAQTPIPFL